MSEIVVVARAKARAGAQEELERALRQNAEASRCEAGCISYSLLRGDDGVFMAVERWKSHGDFDQHMTTPHVQTLIRTISPLLDGPPDIQVMTEV